MRVEAGDEIAVAAGVDHVGVARVGSDPAAFSTADVVPVAFGDAAASAGGDADGGVILLRAVGVIRKIVIEGDAVELRCGLIHHARPGTAAVEGDICAAVVRFDHAVGIVGGDPQAVIVAVRRADGLKAASAIGRPEEAYVEEINFVGVFRVGEDVGVIPGALANLRVSS